MTSNAERIPRLSDVIRIRINKALQDMHVALPGRVENYDATTQKASIQPVIKGLFEDEEGVRQVERLPVIPNVPVQWPQGGGYFISFPLAIGDTGLLLFSEASLDVWLNEGGEVDPLDDRRNHLSDAIFIPGVRSFKTPLSEASGDHAVIGKEGGLQLHINGTTINIGSNEGAQLEFAALGETIANYLTALAAWATAIDTWASSPTLTPPFLPIIGLPPPTPPSFVSTSVKVKL